MKPVPMMPARTASDMVSPWTGVRWNGAAAALATQLLLRSGSAGGDSGRELVPFLPADRLPRGVRHGCGEQQLCV